MNNKYYRLYDELEDLEFYGRHVGAMTGESLHSKTEIAAELAYRDEQIKNWRVKCENKDEIFKKFADDVGDDLATIQQLEAQLAESKPLNNWISVETRLPDEKKYYLVLANDIINQWQEVVMLETHHGKRWLSNDEPHETYVPIITHWQPLPEPPKGE